MNIVFIACLAYVHNLDIISGH